METNLYYELLGYTASVLIAVSLMMSAVIKLRIINLLGATSFALYGVLIGSAPVYVMNTAIAVINIWHLYGMVRATEYFKLLQVPPDSPYLHHFLSFYASQIRRFQPAFDFEQRNDWMPIFILRDAIPTGLVLGTRIGEDRWRVNLDFAIPKYRDFKIARYLFRYKKAFFLAQGIQYIESDAGNREHTEYLERMGFQPDPDNPGRYGLDLRDA